MDDKQPMVFEDLPIGRNLLTSMFSTPIWPGTIRRHRGRQSVVLEHSPFWRPVANPILNRGQHARLFQNQVHHGGKCA